MDKKKDVFGQKLKLTKKEKHQHESLMNIAETISLHWIQLQRIFNSFYRILISLGILVFPKKQIRQKAFRLISKLLTNFGWFILAPVFYQFINSHFAITASINTLFI